MDDNEFEKGGSYEQRGSGDNVYYTCVFQGGK